MTTAQTKKFGRRASAPVTLQSMRTALTLILALCVGSALASEAQELQGARASEAELEPELKPALSAKVSFNALDGGELESIAPQSPFVLDVSIINHMGNEPPAGLEVFGWLRRHDKSNLPCAESAENFFRTGRLPVGAVFLNDPVIGAVTDDNAIVLVDPEFSLASANLLAAQTLSASPAQMVADNESRRFLLPVPTQGTLISIGSGGTKAEIASNLGEPVAVVPGVAGDAFVLDLSRGRLIRLSGGDVPTLPARGLRGSNWAQAAAIWGDTGAMAFSTASGRALIEVPGVADSAAVVSELDTPFALVTVLGNRLNIHYLDAPIDEPVTIDLPEPATALAVSPHGRFVFAYNPLSGPVSVIDVGRSRLVQSTQAKGMPISEVVVTDEAAYLMLADQSRVGVLDLASLARDEAAEFREVPLGSARNELLTGPGMLAPLWPMSGVLAVHAENRQGYRIAEASAMGNAPPMTFTPIRGGIPRRVAVLDRSFREQSPGTFRTVASLPGSGRWELVATSGIGSLSFCVNLPVSETGIPAAEPGVISAVAQSGKRALKVRLTDSDGTPIAAKGLLTFSSLSGAWRDSVAVQTDDNGLSTDIYELPAADTVVVVLDTQNGNEWLPLVLEDIQ